MTKQTRLLKKELIAAAKQMDWGMIAQNGGPACFHLQSNGGFCLRAKAWPGHRQEGVHRFVPLHQMLSELVDEYAGAAG